jgi:oligopeptide/dipeptide ABC transporter ATP-binding protein
MKERVMELLDIVNLPRDMMVRYPSALSGGEKQRAGIARALALNPKIVILDEPTSALDVSVQAKVLRLLRELQQNLQLTYILITHNLSLAKNLADEVSVMYLGRVVEMAETEAIFRNPLHPYTKALLSAIPVITQKEKQILPAEVTLDGDIPSPENPPETCPFLSRCQERRTICEKSPCPDLVEVEQRHYVRCLI